MDRLYWSIDLDFWSHIQQSFPIETFQRFLHLKIPIFIVKEHHSLLKSINSGQYDVVLNSDHHSDIAEETFNLYTKHLTTPLNEGTWGCHVKHRKGMSFIWHYPCRKCLSHRSNGGYCHDFDYSNPFRVPKVTSWRQVFKRQTFAPLDGDGEIVAVGISISPDWVTGRTLSEFEPWYWKALKHQQVESEALSKEFARIYVNDLH